MHSRFFKHFLAIIAFVAAITASAQVLVLECKVTYSPGTRLAPGDTFTASMEVSPTKAQVGPGAFSLNAGDVHIVHGQESFVIKNTQYVYAVGYTPDNVLKGTGNITGITLNIESNTSSPFFRFQGELYAFYPQIPSITDQYGMILDNVPISSLVPNPFAYIEAPEGRYDWVPVSYTIIPPPQIATQPAGGTYISGDDIVLTVSASDNLSLSYQWLQNGVPLNDDAHHTGSTSPSLTLSDVSTQGFGGAYTVRVTNSAGAKTLSDGAIIAVNKAPQTVTFTSIPDKIATDDPFSVTATASSGLAVTYSILSGPAQINGDTITLLGAGAVTVQALQAGDIERMPATANATFGVTKASAKIALSNLSQTYSGTSRTASATTTPSNLPVVISYNGLPTPPRNSGSYTVTASVNTAFYSGDSSDTLEVNPAILVATADNKTRSYGAENPNFTVSYNGFVPGDSKTVLSSEPTGQTEASVSSAIGIYPITLSGGSASNYTLTLQNGMLTVAPINAAGGYFGTFGGNAGTWALLVKDDNTGTFIAHLTGRGSAVVVPLSIDAKGIFSVEANELLSSATGAVADFGLHTGAEKASESSASEFTLVGQVTASGAITGQLSGLGIDFSGQVLVPAGPPSAYKGFYTAEALGTSRGTTFLIVAANGQALSVTTTGMGVESASGVVNQSGHLTATTTSSSTLDAVLDATKQSVAVNMTPSGASAPVVFAGLSSSATSTRQLTNISCRAFNGAGAKVTIGGFVIKGTQPKRLLMRAVGPSLSAFGVGASDTLEDPEIELHDSTNGNAIVTTNDNWGDSGNSADVVTAAASVGAFGFSAGDSQSSALLTTLQPGPYTIVARGKPDTTGVVLIEVYDVDPVGSASTLINTSTRAYCTKDSGVTIGGFAVSGNAPKHALLRAVGPTLTSFGISETDTLQDPIIEVHDASNGNVVIASNDNWKDATNAADILTTSARVGAAPLAEADATSSAMLITLKPGLYSFVARGKNGTSGVVLIEVYDAD